MYYIFLPLDVCLFMVSVFKSATEDSVISQKMHQGGSDSVCEGSRESKLKKRRREGMEGKEAT